MPSAFKIEDGGTDKNVSVKLLLELIAMLFWGKKSLIQKLFRTS